MAENKALIIQILAEPDNPNDFPLDDETKMVVAFRGGGVAKIKVATLTGIGKIEFVGDIGKFYSDAAATQLIGNSFTPSGVDVINDVYAKTTGNGYISFQNASDFTRLGIGSDFNSVNSFITDVIPSLPSFSLSTTTESMGEMMNLKTISSANSYFSMAGDIVQLKEMTKLEIILLLSGSAVTGDFNFVNTFPLFRSISLSGIMLDINNLPNNSYQVVQLSGDITYAGNDNKIFLYQSFVKIAPTPNMTASQCDNLIKSLSKATWGGAKRCEINNQRTIASNDAVAALQALGVTVIVNTPT